ncbi:MAG: hypothetical protein LBI91_01685 [Spirochaetaceae bacterium]|jgi:hypothetical protein|nr:hypothetical protein [Spirochaetaceae bacterium]
MRKRDTKGLFNFSGKRKNRIERRIPLVFVGFSLFLFMPFAVFADDVRLTTAVQIMPITGTNLEDADPIMEAMIAEVQRTEGFTIVQSNAMTSDTVNPTDASQGAEYSISGTLVEEVGDMLFQISLWRLADSSLLLSEEMVYVDLEEALDLVPILVWSLLGNIPSKNMLEDLNWRTKWLYLGLLTGGTLAWNKDLQGYNSDGNKAPDFNGSGIGISPAASLTIMVPFLNIPLNGDPKLYLELQTEVHFSWEWAGYSYHYPDTIPKQEVNKNGLWTDEYSFFSFTFPLMLKIEFSYGPLMLAPYGGAYFYLPLGEAQSRTNRLVDNIQGTPGPGAYVEEESNTVQVSVDGVPLGMTFGFYTGIKMGPGALVIDMRYSKDFGTLTFKDKDGKSTLNGQYIAIDRHKFTLMVGYEIGLFKHERQMEVQVE